MIDGRSKYSGFADQVASTVDPTIAVNVDGEDAGFEGAAGCGHKEAQVEAEGKKEEGSDLRGVQNTAGDNRGPSSKQAVCQPMMHELGYLPRIDQEYFTRNDLSCVCARSRQVVAAVSLFRR